MINANALLNNTQLALKQENVQNLPSLLLTQRHLCDLELILNGGFAPLTSFMSEADYESVLSGMRLENGSVWPMPIMLDVTNDFANKLTLGQEIALRDAEGLLLAFLRVDACWSIDKKREALAVFGTIDEKHPGVHYLFHQTKDKYISGSLTGVTLPIHYDFNHLRLTPAELKIYFKTHHWDKIVAFQTRNPMHRAHFELTQRAADETGAHLLIQPVVGMTKPGDIEYYLRVRCYEHILKNYKPGLAILSLLPLAMRMGGPKEALWHAIIRKNHGCTHFIVGRDHAGPGKDKNGQPFYQPYAAQELVGAYQAEIGIQMVPFQEMLYSHKQTSYFPADQFPQDETPAAISGTELRDALQNGRDIPDWFSFPGVIEALRKAYRLKHQQGLTIFFTGLPSSGKSTLANALALKLREVTDRSVSFLDGDVIRTHLSKGLGFSREDRESNITRVGFVAQEIMRHGGIVICALVAPFANARDQVRQMISDAMGNFLEIHVATSLAVCEKRDRKGLYKKAREGLIAQFTGISDPYEIPAAPEMTIDTDQRNPREIVAEIITYLRVAGYVTT